MTRSTAVQLVKAHKENTVTVLLKDKETGQIIGSKTIKRALLDSYFLPFSGHHVFKDGDQFILEV